MNHDQSSILIFSITCLNLIIFFALKVQKFQQFRKFKSRQKMIQKLSLKSERIYLRSEKLQVQARFH